jgi:hypothetical protein
MTIKTTTLALLLGTTLISNFASASNALDPNDNFHVDFDLRKQGMHTPQYGDFAVSLEEALNKFKAQQSQTDELQIIATVNDFTSTVFQEEEIQTLIEISKFNPAKIKAFFVPINPQTMMPLYEKDVPAMERNLAFYDEATYPSVTARTVMHTPLVDLIGSFKSRDSGLDLRIGDFANPQFGEFTTEDKRTYLGNKFDENLKSLPKHLQTTEGQESFKNYTSSLSDYKEKASKIVTALLGLKMKEEVSGTEDSLKKVSASLTIAESLENVLSKALNLIEEFKNTARRNGRLS